MGRSRTSSDLADAGNTKIIATIIQFAQINQESGCLEEYCEKEIAILTDEAHSSPCGSYIAQLVRSWLQTDTEGGTIDDSGSTVADAIEQEFARTGKQDNVSPRFLTATPKATTLQLFGTTQPDGSKALMSTVWSADQEGLS